MLRESPGKAVRPSDPGELVPYTKRVKTPVRFPTKGRNTALPEKRRNAFTHTLALLECELTYSLYNSSIPKRGTGRLD